MKIAVIGAGITGIATAYELACDGHTVHVFDKAAAAASGDSFATGGVISPGLINPWTLPEWPLGGSHRRLTGSARIKLRGVPSWNELRWLREWTRSPKSQRLSEAFDHFQQVVAWSQARMRAVATKHRLEFERGDGTMLLIPTERDHMTLRAGLSHLKELGLALKELTPEQARIQEPGLGQSVDLHSAVHFPNDEVGNCRQFALLLKAVACELGARFHFDANVLNIESASLHTLKISGWTESPSFDAVALCPGAEFGHWSPAQKLRLPMTVVHGYSFSAPMREPLHAPRCAVVTLNTGTVLSRQGLRVRVTGGAEIGGTKRSPDSYAFQSLFRALNHYFPGSANLTTGTQSWRGARVHTPDGMPVVGTTSTPGVWINAGHGANGWALALGCARTLADRLQDKAPDIDVTSLRSDRFVS